MTMYLEFLVEEMSMEVFLCTILPHIVPRGTLFKVYPFQGKHHLLRNLEQRLRAYAQWIPKDWRLFVVLDCDSDDCVELKQRLEQIALRAGLRTRTSAPRCWQLVNRIVVEELESWYFGEWIAVRSAFPRVPENIPRQRKYRNPDAISGGAKEAFARILKRYNYYNEGLSRIEIARKIGAFFDPSRCRSVSFQCFCKAVQEAVHLKLDLCC